MSLHQHRRFRAAVGLAGVVVVATGGLAFAGSASSSGSASPTPATSTSTAAPSASTATRRDAVSEAVKGGQAKNVILLIGDGMGDSEITIARNYAYGAAGKLPGIDALPLTGEYTTYSLNKDTGLPDYVPDSSATGTAWATGTKTYDNAVSVDRFGSPQETLLELAKQKGLKTGDVTTVRDPGRDPGGPGLARDAARLLRPRPRPRPTARPTPSRTAAPARSPSS